MSPNSTASAETNKKRKLLLSLLGPLPPRRGPVRAKLVSREVREEYVLEHLVLDLNGIEPVPAYFVKPVASEAEHGLASERRPKDRGTSARVTSRGRGTGRLPTVLFNHSHGGRYEIGKDELLKSREYDPNPSYARDLVARGFAVLAIDHWAFGERRGRTESEIFKEFLWRGRVMWGMMVHDSLRALDYLCQRDDVDASRLGTIGMSMGSTMAWWVAALDERVRATVDVCCLTEFEDLITAQGLDGHGLYYYVPALLNHFTCAQINALIAPRAHLGLAGRYDRLTPLPGLQKINAHLRRVYRAAGAADAWRMSLHDVAHLQTAAMRQEAMEFLELHL